MYITFRQLKLFLAVVDHASVSAAAKAMHITQPTASMQLKEISQTVGLPLYEIIGKKIFFTDTGQELAQTARQMMQAWDLFEQQVDAAKGLAKGKLKVSVVSTAKYFMPRLIGQFCKQHPAVDVSLEILNRDGVVKRMRDNLDDLYIMSQPPKDIALHDEVFLSNPLVAIAANANALTKLSSVSLSQLTEQRFILRERGSGTRMVADHFLKKNKLKVDIRMELGSNEAIKEAVAGGLGIGIISLHALHGHRKENGVTVLPVKGFPILSQWHIVHHAKKQLSPIAQGFKQHLLKNVRSQLS
jgi:DNA-binding transcriptional LysR family regulator